MTPYPIPFSFQKNPTVCPAGVPSALSYPGPIDLVAIDSGVDVSQAEQEWLGALWVTLLAWK